MAPTPGATRRAILLAILLAVALTAAACGGDSSDYGEVGSTSGATDESTASSPDSATGEASGSTADPASGTTADADASGSSGDPSTVADPSTLLTDEEAAEYFGEPAIHQGPTALGAFTNVEYYPATGTGQTLIVTTWAIGSLELFENQVKAEAEALGDTAQKLDGIGESAYFSVGTLKFYKNGGYYQITGTDPKSGEDMLTALIPLATKMASRVP